MVKIQIKKADENQFLLETTVTRDIDDLFKEVAAIYNGRLKVMRICAGNHTKVPFITGDPNTLFFMNTR